MPAINANVIETVRPGIGFTPAHAAETPAPESTNIHGFAGLKCMECGQSDCITVKAYDLDEGWKCEQCDAEFTLADAVAAARQWLAVAAWIESAPRLP